MEHITRNNLDQWLFDYFEGNLQEEQSLQLRRFVKENPDLKTEWEHWQKTYFSEPLPSDKVFVESLKKKNFWQEKKFYWTASVLIATGILFLLWFKNDPISETKEIKTERKERPQHSSTATPDITSQQEPVQKQDPAQIKKEKIVKRTTIVTTDSSVVFQKETPAPIIRDEEKRTSTIVGITKDTATGPQQVAHTKPETTDSKTKKEKKRKKLDLTPSDRIIKTNPDF